MSNVVFPVKKRSVSFMFLNIINETLSFDSMQKIIQPP